MKLENNYQSLVNQIKSTYTEGKAKAVKVVRRELVLTYWAVGKHIVEFEQKGNEKSEYGAKILNRLSKYLSDQLGRGFSRTNLSIMRLMYLNYSNLNILSDQLSWGHFVELLNIDHALERSFYEKQAVLEKWTVRELKRQKSSSLFLRLAASQDKEGILKLANAGNKIEKPEDIIRDSYVFEFLKIPEPHHVSEKELETRLIDDLQSFLLELGKGFTFVGRHYSFLNIKRTYRMRKN